MRRNVRGAFRQSPRPAHSAPPLPGLMLALRRQGNFSGGHRPLGRRSNGAIAPAARRTMGPPRAGRTDLDWTGRSVIPSLPERLPQAGRRLARREPGDGHRTAHRCLETSPGTCSVTSELTHRSAAGGLHLGLPRTTRGERGGRLTGLRSGSCGWTGRAGEPGQGSWIRPGFNPEFTGTLEPPPGSAGLGRWSGLSAWAGSCPRAPLIIHLRGHEGLPDSWRLRATTRVPVGLRRTDRCLTGGRSAPTRTELIRRTPVAAQARERLELSRSVSSARS